MKLLICGDMIFDYGDYSYGDVFFQQIKMFIEKNNYDFVTANLEGPLTNNNKAILKNGPSLRFNQTYIYAIKDIGINLVTLSNNHIMDYGVEGLKNTIDTLEKNKIEYIGIKNNIYEKNVFFYKKNDVIIAFYSVCENEFSSWKRFEIGANALDIIDTINDIKSIKNKCDYLIVLFHGGKELFSSPTPWNQHICKAFVDSGANFVFEQHSHIVGDVEKYKDSLIVYGQGDFINKSSNKRNAVLFELDISKRHFEYKTITINREDIKKPPIIDNGHKLSVQLFNNYLPDIVMTKYLHNLSFNKYSIFYQILRKNRIYQLLDVHCFHNWLIKKSIKKNRRYILLLFNYINCETHREELIALLEDVIK